MKSYINVLIFIYLVVGMLSCSQPNEELSENITDDVTLIIHRGEISLKEARVLLEEGHKPYLSEDGYSYYFLDSSFYEVGNTQRLFVDTLWLDPTEYE